MVEQRGASEVFDTAALNSMLRGEMAAVESYNLAIRHTAESPHRMGLTRIRDQHQNCVCALRHWVRDLHVAPSQSSGAWGCFATLVTGAASVVGWKTLVAALKRGEHHGEAVYRTAMGNPDLPDDLRHLIGAQLLPMCSEHIAKLERLLTAIPPSSETTPDDQASGIDRPCHGELEVSPR